MTSMMKLLSGILTLHMVMALTGCGINELPSVAEKTPAFTTAPTVPVTENTIQGTDATEETAVPNPPAATQPQVKEDATEETKPTEPPASQVPETNPTEPVDTAPPETEPMETVPPPTQQPAATEPSIPPATEPPPTVPPVIEPEPTQPPTEPSEPVGCSHDWVCIHHNEEGHWIAGVICDCGWVIYGNPDEVVAIWNAHSASFPPEESLIMHGGYGCADEWVVDAPAYEEWHCSLCGETKP